MENNRPFQNIKAAHKREIVISKDDTFPITVKIVNNSNRIEETYNLVRTKNDKFMLQK